MDINANQLIDAVIPGGAGAIIGIIVNGARKAARDVNVCFRMARENKKALEDIEQRLADIEAELEPRP